MAKDGPPHTTFCEESSEIPECYSSLIASQKPFLITFRSVLFPYLDLKPSDIRKKETALCLVPIRMLPSVLPLPPAICTFSMSRQKGLLRRRKNGIFFKVGWFVFFPCYCNPWTKIRWCFQQSKVAMHKCS